MGKFETLAYRLKNLRLSLGMTQVEFAREVGCTSTTLSAYENNLKKPSLDIIMDICDKFDISMDFLCGLSDRPNGTFEPKTYSEVIFMLAEVGKKLDLCIQEKSNYTDNTGFQRMGCALHLSDYQMEKYLSDWSKYKKLKNTGSIDDDIYNACMSKLYKESNIEFPKSPF